MPQVLIPVAITAAAAGAGVALGAVTVTAAVITVGAAVAAAGVGYLTQPRGNGNAQAIDASDTQVSASSPVNQQRNIPVRQAVPPRRYVYGNVRVGGVVYFQDNRNPYLYIGIALSDGEVGGVYRVFFGDTEVPIEDDGTASAGSIYYGNFNFETSIGEASQVASTLLAGVFETPDSNFRQRGVARAVFRLNWGDDAESHNALWGDSVSPSVVMLGATVHDPRDVGSDPDDVTTWSYQPNPALAVAHALTHAWGVALDSADIDWASFETAADACDATITYGSSSVATYEIAGIFQAGSDMASQIVGMLASFGGTLIDVDGKIGVRVDEARASVWTITDDDILEFGEYVHAGPYAETYNAIKAKFFDADADGVEATTPVYEMLTEQAAEGLRETSIDLPYVAKTHSAQILAYMQLMRSRAGRRLTLTLSDAALFLDILDRVTISSDAAPFADGDYEVVQIDLSQYGAIVQLREYPEDAYADPSTYLV